MTRVQENHFIMILGIRFWWVRGEANEAHLNKIECCGAKVSHGHCLVAADPAHSKKERTKKQFLETTLPSLFEIVSMYKVLLVNEGKAMTRGGRGQDREGQEPE